MPRTFIIGEAGSCHDGNFGQALELIRIAKDAGADAVKFQYWSDPIRLAERRNAPDYQPIYTKYKLPMNWLRGLHQECARGGIEFMCTVYLPEDIHVVAPYVQRFKIASFEAGDLAFIRAHEPYHKPVIISTGMMDKRPVHTHGDMEVWWLHCVSAYPTPWRDANLGVLRSGEYDGYSDHTNYVHTGALAVAAGASIIEVHFRSPHTDANNPDYATSLDSDVLGRYIAWIRRAEIFLGDGIKRIQPSEAEMVKYRVQP